jgi:hypothetical protein
MNRFSDVVSDSIPDEGKQRRKRRSKDEIAEDLRSRLEKVTGAESGLDLKTPKSLSKEISVTIAEFNSLLLMTPWTYKDALNQMEADALIQGLDQTQQTDPKFRKQLTKFVGSTGKVGLLGAVAMILVNRAVLHNWIPIPDETKQQIQQQMAQASADLERQKQETEQRQAQYGQQHDTVQPLADIWSETQPVG